MRAGVGIGFVRKALAARDPELVASVLGFDLPSLALAVVTRAGMRTSVRTRTVLGSADCFEGPSPPEEMKAHG